MIVTTNIIDVLPDGTIIEASFTVPNAVSLTVTRDNLDAPFTITACDVQSRDETVLSKAISAIQKTMHEHEIDLLIPIAKAQNAKAP